MFGEAKEDNDLFFTCSLIEYIARKTKNTKKVVIEKLGKANIEKIYKLAEVYHSENIEKVSDEFIEKTSIKMGDYDNISKYKSRIPTYWEIGKVYKRLIVMLEDDNENYANTLMEVLSSWIIDVIDNYDSSMYYENPDYIYQCYKEGKVI